MTNDHISMYMDLDSLFDTRIATLYRLDVEKVMPAMMDGYFDRVFDEFSGYDPEVYAKAWKARDETTIENSAITGMVDAINFFAEKTLVARVGTPLRKQPKLELNIHPYVLSDACIDAIVLGLRAVTKNMIDIQIIDRPLSEITPEYVKSNYAIMVMYEYWEWLECHSENKNLLTTRCPNITLIGPAIVRSKEAWEEVKHNNVFDAIEQYSSVFIKLMLYPISSFCLNLSKRDEEAKKEAMKEASVK